MSCSLPRGWVEATDPNSGRTYYANPKTRETRWDPPPCGSASAVKSLATKSTSKHSKDTSKHSASSNGSNKGKSDSASASKACNPLLTRPEMIQAWSDPARLVPMAREMLDTVAAFPSESLANDTELENISAGQIADLCHIQMDTKACGENVPYTPLNPYRMSKKSQKDLGEEGRLDVRIFALKQKLQKYGGSNTSNQRRNL